MNIEKSREQFEAWNPLAPGCVFHEGKYGFWIVWDEGGDREFSTGMGFTQTKWEAWQASRAAIEIELPTCTYLGNKTSGLAAAESWNGGILAAKFAIESHGIKVKS